MANPNLRVHRGQSLTGRVRRLSGCKGCRGGWDAAAGGLVLSVRCAPIIARAVPPFEWLTSIGGGGFNHCGVV